MQRFIDAHCHFDFPVFDGRRDEILDEAAGFGLEAIVMPGVAPSNWGRIQQLAEEDARLWFAPGVHPWWVDDVADDVLVRLEGLLAQRHPRCLAIGECGLDRLRGALEIQEPFFAGQIELARRHSLPLLIHSVRTHDMVVALLREKRFSGPGLLHAFNGSWQQADQLWSRGLFIGVSGAITYPRARRTREAIQRLPLEALVLETDAPDMPPAGVAKGQNTPLNLKLIFDQLCKLRPEPSDRIARQIRQNTEVLFWGAWS